MLAEKCKEPIRTLVGYFSPAFRTDYVNARPDIGFRLTRLGHSIIGSPRYLLAPPLPPRDSDTTPAWRWFCLLAGARRMAGCWLARRRGFLDYLLRRRGRFRRHRGLDLVSRWSVRKRRSHDRQCRGEQRKFSSMLRISMAF